MELAVIPYGNYPLALKLAAATHWSTEWISCYLLEALFMSDYSNCRLCGEISFPRKGNIRTKKKILANKILECSNCGFVFLNNDSHISDYHYEESLMHDFIEPLEDSRSSSKEDDLRRFTMLETDIRNKNLLEVGCGNGGFLKLAQKSAKTIQGIEPEKKYHEFFTLEQLNIDPSLLDAGQKIEAVDVVVSFHVIEHVKDPLAFLTQILELLKVNGKLFIETPNSNDALIKLYDSTAFQDFTYWDNHLILFNNKSFEHMLNKIEGITYKSIPVQRYGVANHLHWLSTGKPGGHQHWSFLETELIRSEYMKNLSELLMNDTLFYVITKINDECKVRF